MKPRKILSVILAVLTLTTVLSGCTENNDNQTIVYEDMKTAFEKTDLLSANIGIFTKTENDGSVSYGSAEAELSLIRKTAPITRLPPRTS